MSEHRKEPRKKLMAFTPVSDAKNGNLLGYVGNLTLLGVMVIGEHPIEVNREMLVTIEFPNNLTDVITSNITLHARVAWCRQDDPSAQNYSIGFEFTDATPTHTKIFQAILERYQFRQDTPTSG